MSKKRIKMTDKELAVAMWIYVKEYIKSAELCTESLPIPRLKVDFLKAHGKGMFYWYNDCLLCQRHINENGECNCPLSENGKDCGMGSTWWDVIHYAITEEHRQMALKACDKIIKIMEAENE